MKPGNPPPAPDPVATANAQAEANSKAAIKQQMTNMVDQYTPTGNLNYTQNGTWSDGTPRFTATQTYTPEAMESLKQQQQLDQMTNQLAIDQTGRLQGILSKPVNLNNEATEARLFELGSKRLDPRFAQQRDQLDTTLANKGITMGSAAWNAANTQQREGENDAYNQLLLTGRGQAVNEALQERNQPINEITALLGAGQISTPDWTSTPTAGVAAAPIADLTMQNYGYQMDAYKQKVGSQNALLGGIAGLGGAALGGWMRSDRRLKADVQLLGKAGNGLNVYAYRFIDGGPEQIGHMADEVAKVRPDAVREIDGVLHVNYAMLEG